MAIVRSVNKRCAIPHACLFTCLTKARCAIHRTSKIYNLSLLVFLSSDFLLFENRSLCFFSFRICRKTCSCGLDFKENFLLYMGQPRIIFSHPSKVEIVVKNELYHVKKNPFKCIKNNYFCWKQSRKFFSFAVKKAGKSYKHLHCCIFSHLSHCTPSHASVSQGERMIAHLLIFSLTGLYC